MIEIEKRITHSDHKIYPKQENIFSINSSTCFICEYVVKTGTESQSYRFYSQAVYL